MVTEISIIQQETDNLLRKPIWTQQDLEAYRLLCQLNMSLALLAEVGQDLFENTQA